MILQTKQTFDQMMLDHDNSSEFLKFVIQQAEQELVSKLIDELQDHKIHIREERHHINNRCPDDVDLIDIIEHIVDCCCAGKTRSGYISPVVIDPEIFTKAVENTVKLIDNNTRIV